MKLSGKGRIQQEAKGIFVEPALRMAVGHLLEESTSAAGGDGGAR